MSEHLAVLFFFALAGIWAVYGLKDCFPLFHKQFKAMRTASGTIPADMSFPAGMTLSRHKKPVQSIYRPSIKGDGAPRLPA